MQTSNPIWTPPPAMGFKDIFCYRGLPGSGKSTKAIDHAQKLGVQHFETDMWLYEFEDQDYYWTPQRLSKAIREMYRAVRAEFETGKDIVITGVFGQHKDIKGYINMASQYGYAMTITEMRTQYKNIHSVPDDALEHMKKRFVSVDDFPQYEHVDYYVIGPGTDSALR